MRRLLGNHSEGGTNYLIFKRARQQELKCFGPKKRSSPSAYGTWGHRQNDYLQSSKAERRVPSGFVSNRDDDIPTSYRMGSPMRNPQTSRSYEPQFAAPALKSIPDMDSPRYYDEALGSEMGASKKSGRSMKSGKSARLDRSGESVRTGRSGRSNRRVMFV